jgi:hypothetical protein
VTPEPSLPRSHPLVRVVLCVPFVLYVLVLTAPLPAAVDDPRGFEVVRYECANELGRREVTLFLNGTVRLRDGEPGKEAMGLAELNPDEMDGALHRLADENLTEAQHLPSGVEGTWIEKCMLALHLPDKPIQVFHFGRYDALPLSVSRIVRVVEDVAAKVPDVKGNEELPVKYEPRVGDVLKRVDGNLYAIHGISEDKQGIELQGVVQPLTVYIRKDHLRLEFVALVKRAS